MTTKVVKGSLWTIAGQVVPLAVSLVAAPLIIRLLGAEGYGVLILVTLIPTYVGFADFGMSMASTKFGSEAYAEGDEEKEGRVVRTAAMIALVTSVPIAALLTYFSVSLIELFNVPDYLRADAALALKLASITFVVNFLCGIFNTPQLARLRMDLNTFVNAGSRIAGLIVAPIVIFLGFGITGAVSVLLVASLLNLFGHLLVSKRLLPHVVGITVDRTILKYLLKFGMPLAFSSIAAVLLVNSEKLILTKVTSVRVLAYYAVAFTFANMATMFSGAMSQSLVPAFSQLLTPEKKDHLNNLYSRALRLNVIGLLPLLFISAIAAKPFFTFWAGEDFGRESTLPFYVLLFGLFFHLSSYVSGSLIISCGRTDIIAKLFWAELVPFLALTGVLTMHYGAVGAAVAWSVRVVVESFLMVWLAKKVGGVKFEFACSPINVVLGVLILSPPIFLLVLFKEPTIWVFVLSPICLAAYIVFTWITLIDRGEKVWLSKKVHIA